MKQILRLGESYGLSAIKRYVLYGLFTSIYTILLPGSSAQAQSTNIKDLGIPEGGLKIGDSVPEALWNLPLQVVNHPEGKDTITLNDYRGKLIILDFWAHYCKPCLASLVKLDSLQQEIGRDEFIVIPVQVYDMADKAQACFDKMQWQWPTVVNNTVFNKLLLPRYLTGFGAAWLYNGKLLAVPQKKYVNKENIMKAIRGEQPVLENRTTQY